MGSDIGLDRETGQVNRRRVYQAVQIFEDRNRNLIHAPVIDRNGDYLDREFLYSAYNRYVGMSHRQDSDLAPFRELIENAADMDSRNMTKAHLQDIYTAEVYFAHCNGLNQDQIEYMVVNSAGVELPSGTSPEESMMNIRHAFEQGMTEEEVDLIIGQESFVQQEILAYLYDGETWNGQEPSVVRIWTPLSTSCRCTGKTTFPRRKPPLLSGRQTPWNKRCRTRPQEVTAAMKRMYRFFPSMP